MGFSGAVARLGGLRAVRALVYGGIYYFFEPRRDAVGLFGYVLVLTAVLVAIVQRANGPSAGWGKK